jgi:integrase
MTNVVHVDFSSTHEKEINVSEIKHSRRILREGIIAPADEDTSYQIANEHTSEPIKDMDDIKKISDWFIKNEHYRDNMLFIVGINFGLRVSDLLTLRFSHLIDEAFRFKTTFPILEKKTKNTRKVQKNRYISINDAVMDAVTLYLENTPGVKLSDYMFRSESNRGKNVNQPIHRNSAERILKEAGNTLGLNIHIATHTLRKTFAYHQMLMSNNDPRKLLLLQKMFGHSTSAQTLDYIGITREEIEDAYLKLNLGTSSHYLIDSVIDETNKSIG